MQATIKKVHDKWEVKLSDNPVTGVFDTHHEAVKAAYRKGAEKFDIKYSPRVSRLFERVSIENFYPEATE